MLSKSMILQIFYGLKGHHEQVPLSEDYKKHMKEVVEQDDKMLELLKNAPELCEQYKKTTDALDGLNCASDDMCFIEGFKIGLLIGLEAGEYLHTEND